MRAARLRPALRVGRARRCFASASAPDASAPSVRAMCNGVWDMYHAGHANAWLQAKLNTGAAGQDVSIVVAVHDGADVLEHKGAPTIFDDAERRAMAEACKWVSGTVAHVPYDVITEQLMDEHGCAWVSHGDDMIILPGKPHMYSEADEVTMLLVLLLVMLLLVLTPRCLLPPGGALPHVPAHAGHLHHGAAPAERVRPGQRAAERSGPLDVCGLVAGVFGLPQFRRHGAGRGQRAG